MEALLQKRAFLQLLRTDFKSFYIKSFNSLNGEKYLDAGYVDLLCDYAHRVISGDVKRLNICIPPRSGKSLMFSVALPAFLMGHFPKTKIITASYAQDLASKFARDQRTIMEQPWYKNAFPQTRLNPRKSGEEEFETTRGGFRMATSPGGRLTGRGADFIIFDDIMKPGDAASDTLRSKTNTWFDDTAYTRLNDKQDGAIINIMQRLHENDFVDHLTQKGGWELLELPAIAETKQRFVLSYEREYIREKGDVLHPQREPKHVLESIRSEIGTMNFSAQYQQQPVPQDGNMVRWEWFQEYTSLPHFKEIVISWDTASGNTNASDYSACTVWGVSYEGYFSARDASFYLLDVHKDRLLFPELIKRVKALHEKHKATYTIVEDCSSGIQLIQQLRSDKLYGIKSYKPTSDKVSRLYSHTAYIERGQVFIPTHAPWLDDFRKEILCFPNSKHDDQVDSFSQFLNWASERKIVRVL